MTKEPPIRERALRTLRENPDENLTTHDIEEATGLTREQVHSVMSVLARDAELSRYVKRVASGVYRYDPEGSWQEVPAGYYEETGQFRGVTIVRDSQGELYGILPLDELDKRLKDA